MQAGSFFARFTPPVNGNQEVMASAFYVERYFPIVANNDGADIEAMRSYRGDGNCFAMGHNDRTAYAE